jgi:tetratricopeptide (TPR) repeat protein
MPRFRPLAVVLVSAMLVAGCKRDHEAVYRRHVAAGDAYFAQKKYPEAVIEYRVAIDAAPNSGSTRFKLAEAYAAQSLVTSALEEYVRAADLMPDNAEAQLKAGNLLLLSRQFEDANARARQILARDPNNAPALLMLGNALAGLKQFDEALAANRRAVAVALDSTASGMYLNLGTIAFIEGEREEAERAFLKAVEIDGANPETHVGLANFYWAAGRPADAERALKAALKLNPAHVVANQILAALYIALGRGREAEAHLKTAANAAKTIPARLDLADFYAALGREAAALEILNAVAREPNGFAIATGRMALMHSAKGRTKEAMALLDAILKREPKNAAALAIKAHLAIGNHDLLEAKRLAEEAVAADVNSVRAQFAHGRVLYALGRTEDARKAFNQVLQLNPLAAEAHVELSRLHLARREIDSAIQFAESGVKSAPRYLDAHLSLMRALMVRPKELRRAENEIRFLLQTFPASPEVHMVNGEFLLERAQPAAAKLSFERALQVDPSFVDALDRLVSVDVKAGRMAEARRRVDAALAQSPNSSGVLVVAGKTYAAAGDKAAGERFLRRAIDINPAHLSAYGTLAGFYLVERRLADASREFIQIAQRRPTESAPPTMVGILAEAQGQPADAEQWYKRALAVNPGAAAAANNLAWLYAERGDQLDLALQLAQSANAQLPNQPEVGDTLGWVYYKKGMFGMAVPALERSVQMDPDNPIYRFHLGLVHARLGEDRKARLLLEAALRLNPDFPGAAEAKRVLAKLVY